MFFVVVCIAFKKTGRINRISVSKSGDTPVTYTATITFATATMTAEQDNSEVNSG